MTPKLTPTLTHASGTPWVNSNEYAAKPTDWFAPTGWTLVSLYNYCYLI